MFKIFSYRCRFSGLEGGGKILTQSSSGKSPQTPYRGTLTFLSSWLLLFPKLSEEDCEEATEVCFKDVISTADQLFQLKFIHHLHCTPAKLAHMGLGSDIACSRCGLTAVNLLHMFWNCPGLTSFWKDSLSITLILQYLRPRKLDFEVY